MKISNILSLSTRMFKTRPLRTFLTVLGMGVGIGTVLFLVSLGYGLQNAILGEITTADSLLSLDVDPGSESIALTRESVKSIEDMPEIAEVSPVLDLHGQIVLDDFSGDGSIQGVNASFFRLNGTSVQSGRLFTDARAHEAIISSAGVKLYNMKPEEIIGKEISLVIFMDIANENGTEEVKTFKRDEKYKIVGVIEDDSSNYIFIPEETISDLEIVSYSKLKVKVTSSEVIEQARTGIMDKGFLVSALSDTIEQTEKIFRGVQIVLGLFGLVALIVSAIGMFNTMTISLLERTQEIGIMRSLGVTSRDIRRMFLVESMLMGAFGGVGGVLIGLAAGKITNFGINLLATNFGGRSFNLFYCPTWFLIFVLCFSCVIGFLTGVYPSFKASRLNPLEALKYK